MMSVWSWNTSDHYSRVLLVFGTSIQPAVDQWGELQSDSSLTMKASLNRISVFDSWVGSFAAIGALMSSTNRATRKTVRLAMDHFSCTSSLNLARTTNDDDPINMVWFLMKHCRKVMFGEYLEESTQHADEINTRSFLSNSDLFPKSDRNRVQSKED